MSHHLPHERKRKKTRRGGRRRKKLRPSSTMRQTIDPQPMDGSVDPLRRKASLARVLLAKNARAKSAGAKTPQQESQRMEASNG